MLIIQLFDTSTLDCQLTCEPIELQGKPSTSKAKGNKRCMCTDHMAYEFYGVWIFRILNVRLSFRLSLKTIFLCFISDRTLPLTVTTTPLKKGLKRKLVTDHEKHRTDVNKCPICHSKSNGIWVQCQKCEQWFHCRCLGLPSKKAKD